MNYPEVVVKFTDKFNAKREYETLNRREKGLLRFEKLIESEKDGTLQFAKERSDLARIAGYPEGQCGIGKTGYSWVCGLIQKGRIEEIPRTTADGAFYREYRIAELPDYHNEGAAKVNSARAGNTSIWIDESIKTSPEFKNVTIEFGNCNTKISIENCSVEFLSKLMKGLENGN